MGRLIAPCTAGCSLVLSFLLPPFVVRADDRKPLPGEKPPYQRLLQGEDAKKADELKRQVDSLLLAGKFAEALAPAEEILALRQRVQGADHDMTVDARHTVETLRHVHQLPPAAQADFVAAIKAVAQATPLMQQGRPGQAEPHFRTALELFQKSVGEDHVLTARCYNQLGHNLCIQEKYAAAEPFCQKAVTLRLKLLGENHPNTSHSFGNLARAHHHQGRYATAEPLYQKALAISRAVYGEESEVTVTAYNNLASNLRDRGQDAAAELLFRTALDLARKVYGEKHATTATCLGNLANCLARQRRPVEAEPLLHEALAIMLNLPPEAKADTASAYSNLAMCINQQGKFSTAEPLYQKALALSRQAHGEEHPLTATIALNLSTNLRDQGKLADAELLVRQAAATFHTILGDSHPKSVTATIHLAYALNTQGKYAEAEQLAADATRAFRTARLQAAFTGLDRAGFTDHFSPLSLLPAVQARNGKPAEAWQSLEEGLARGLLDDLTGRLARPLTPEERGREEQLVGRIDLLDRQIAALLTAKNRTDAYREQAARLRQQRDRLQADLGNLETALARKYGPASGEVFPLERIRGQIPADAALVAWLDGIRETKAEADPAGDHWACVVRRQGQPRWVKLTGTGPGGAWVAGDGLLTAQLRRHSILPPTDGGAGWQETARRLYRQRLDPLTPHLGAADGLPAVRHLVILPSSTDMSGIPIEVFVAARPDGATAWTISHAPSGTLFAWLREKKAGEDQGPPRLLALGDPAFATAGARVAVATRAEAFQPLPGTRREVEGLAALFPKADLLLGSDASEQRLDQLAAAGQLRAYRYLHLATHGRPNLQEPMLSHLALAQDNLPDPLAPVLEGKAAFTGELTAAHILRRWKLNADLVTLSACQSGMGRYQRGEGYLGFAQGLFLAGARSLVLSLWKVDDTATALLMLRFYENLLGKREGLTAPLPKAEALSEAKQWLRNLGVKEMDQSLSRLPQVRGEEREKPPAVSKADKPFAHPYYWSAFILIGDPE